MVAAMICSVVPDLDGLGLGYGIPYGHLFGHRGFFHSLFFALIMSGVATGAARQLRTQPLTAFAVTSLSGLSHCLLDACTSGGLGVAFLSPFSNVRYFFPWRPIAVAPVDIIDLVSSWGLRVLRSEAAWIWAPSGLLALCIRIIRGWIHDNGEALQ